ncbi:MAG: ABC transporter substrate-binding protein [Pseudobdellovibrionaceae bacterium]
MTLSLPRKLMLGRLLTRSGDQAWDFAVPLVLLKIFPDQLRIAAIYYLLAKLMNVLLLPKIASLIDKLNRKKTARLGIVLQLVGVLVGAGSISILAAIDWSQTQWMSVFPILVFASSVLGGFLASIGSSFMDIAISSDLVPSSLDKAELAKFNSRLQQIDLFTEVASPVIAGFILFMDSPISLAGFYLVALWNVISFFPELGILQSIFNERPELDSKEISTSSESKDSILRQLMGGWRAFFKEPIAPVALAYAFLWLSVLSPHGVLLAGFLKDAWKLPEWAIGSFRGAGAFFGLAATVVFPFFVKKMGLLKSTQRLIQFQSVMLIFGLLCFYKSENLWGQIGFLVFILFSRIGIYGFSLGEMQVRQTRINPAVRGQVNGFASALTGIATLFLYGAGALLPKTSDFQILVVGSVAFVCLGAFTYSRWLYKQPQEKVGRV